MKNILILTVALLLNTFQINGQIQYVEIEQNELMPTHFNDMDFSDVDGDGDVDFVMAGAGINFDFRTYLYLNDGTGYFSKVPDTNFPEVFQPSVVFVDIDGDNDEDLFISGTDYTDTGHTHFYTNDGTGNFTAFPSNILSSLSSYDYQAAFSDIDNDGDQDMCLIGGDFLGFPHAKLYFNDGTGNFTEDIWSAFLRVGHGTINFIDIDNDGDKDLLITGNVGFDAHSSLYENDGTGKFDLLTTSNLRQFSNSAVAFSDIDGDGDQDFIISGTNNEQTDPVKTVIYKNNGDGVFLEMTSTDFDQLSFNSMAFGDMEGDGDEDLLVTGYGANGLTKLYENDGTGNFSEIPDVSFQAIRNGIAAFEEISGDDKVDILFSGQTPGLPNVPKIIKVYEYKAPVGIEEPIPTSSFVKSYTFLNQNLNVELNQNYKSIEVMVFNILGQQMLSEKYNNINHFKLNLGATVGLQFIAIEINNEKIEVIKLL